MHRIIKRRKRLNLRFKTLATFLLLFYYQIYSFFSFSSCFLGHKHRLLSQIEIIALKIGLPKKEFPVRHILVEAIKCGNKKTFYYFIFLTLANTFSCFASCFPFFLRVFVLFPFSLDSLLLVNFKSKRALEHLL